ncbi:MAG TPA: glycosyltransferase [Tepidisphaeraceae bacterium]|jgi:hypothetical protein|nr:glycosyltransferase [Tepidisphaeraceae bacterium]
MNPIYIVGYPSYVGGADTELWHTIKLWRSAGIEVRMVPTWVAPADWIVRLEQIGVPTFQVAGPDDLASIPGLFGSTVISFCNGEFLNHAHWFKGMECRIVWVNCMTWAFPKEIEQYEQHGPFDRYVFQSNFQRQALFPALRKFGVTEDQCHLIRGAFAFDEFPFSPSPHVANEPFVFGRIARPDLDKWSSNLWPIYGAVQYANKQARVMAWDDLLTKKCGPPPPWALALKANAEPARKFMAKLHCMFPINGGARENWPRSGLEAMASGVPIVAQREWGWCEMIEHGVTGFLGGDDCELAHFAAALAHDEELRLQIAKQARHRLVTELASPKTILPKWINLLEGLDSSQQRMSEFATSMADRSTSINGAA